jgi:hypothetical protein
MPKPSPKSTDPRRLRRRYFVDAKVQGAMLVRVLLYWFCCMVSITALVVIWRLVSDGPTGSFWNHFDDLWTLYKPVAVASALLIPLMMFDVIRFSHRFVGPMYRLRNCMEKLARDEEVAEMRFRDKDYWQDYAEAFNALRKRMRQLNGWEEEAEEAAQPDAPRVQRDASRQRDEDLVAV